MEALFDPTGQVYAWLERKTGRIVDLRGQHLAFLEGDCVYNWRGRHVAWWFGDHIRNQSGKIAVFMRNADKLGIGIPPLKSSGVRPTPAVTPSRPGLGQRPARPQALPAAWAAIVPF